MNFENINLILAYLSEHQKELKEVYERTAVYDPVSKNKVVNYEGRFSKEEIECLLKQIAAK